MGRLIDEDVLIERIYEYQIKAIDTEDVIHSIKTMPTAYDIEKVVADLEQQAEQYKRRALELVEKSTEAGIHNKGKACSYEHAIEIVRKGGLER